MAEVEEVPKRRVTRKTTSEASHKHETETEPPSSLETTATQRDDSHTDTENPEASAATAEPGTPGLNETLIDESAAEIEAPSIYDDGGFLQAVLRLGTSLIGVCVYAYAIWLVVWSIVWIGSISSLRHISFTFGGVTLASNVVVYEGVANVNHAAKGTFTIPSFSWSPFPTTIDHTLEATAEPLSSRAFQQNLLLLALFFLQHIVVAHAASRNVFSKILQFPSDLDTSFYVASSAALAQLTFTYWVPISGVVWDFSHNDVIVLLASYGFFVAVFLAILSSFLAGHWALFGVSSSFGFESKPAFVQTSVFAHVRHPIQASIIAALWCTPTLTYGHALFSAGVTALILVSTKLKDQELLNLYGESYLQYMQSVPALCACWCWCCSWWCSSSSSSGTCCSSSSSSAQPTTTAAAPAEETTETPEVAAPKAPTGLFSDDEE